MKHCKKLPILVLLAILIITCAMSNTVAVYTKTIPFLGNITLNYHTDVEESLPGVSVSATISNQWQQGNLYYCQINTIIENRGQSVSNWKMVITADHNFEVTQLWNGNYTTSANTISITPVSWNNTISSNSKLDSVGFIVRSTVPIKITSAKCVRG